jgi:hypothetical protein
LPPLQYWQAAGLLILVRVLFGGIGGGHFFRLAHGNPFRDRWHGMKKEEMEAFIKRHHYGFDERHDPRFREHCHDFDERHHDHHPPERKNEDDGGKINKE